MERKQGASAEPGRRRRRQEAKQTGPRGRGAVGGAGAALRFLAGRRGEVSGYGAPVRPAPDLQREWDLSGGVWGCGGTGPCWGSASWGPAGGGLRQPHRNPGPASVPVQLGGAGWLRSDHSLSLPADPSSPASAASFCAGAPAFPQCVGGLEMRGPRTGPSWLPVPWLGTAS